MNLTKEQEDIISSCNSNLYIAAGPGSGKSTVLSLICDRLLQNPSNKVTLITFTNKAAKSIMSKCENLDMNRITGGTFHGIAYRYLKAAGCTSTICDDYKQRLIVKKLFNCKKDREKLEEILEEISICKSNFPIQYNDRIQQYNSELQKYDLLDFDDIIIRYIERPRNNTINNGPTHILVDELQDTSAQQLQMLRTIHDDCNGIMIGVGDDDQCIYEWRNARYENVEDFIKVFNCKVMNMGFNFRSDKLIVDKSVNLILNNKKRLQKTIRSSKDALGTIVVKKCDNFLEEIDYITLKCRMESDKKIAILYRNRTHKNHLEFSLKKNKLDYTVNDIFEITDRSAIKSMMSCLRIASSNFDEYDLEQAARALKAIGKVTVQNIVKDSKDKSIILVLDDLLKDEKKSKRLFTIKSLRSYFKRNKSQPLNLFLNHIETLFNSSFEYAKEIKSFLDDITKDRKVSLESINELINELGLDGKEEHHSEDARIELSTVHGYKGCQAPIIIVPFIDQYLEFRQNRKIDIEAERRLFYVAITRPENKLILTYSGSEPKFIKEMKLDE